MVVLLPLNQSGKVGGGIKGGAVGFQDDAGRHLFLVLRLLHLHHQRALALHGVATVLQRLNHAGDIGLRVAFALPQVKFHIQVGVVLFQIRHGHVHHMTPNGKIAGIALLELQSCLVGSGGERRIHLAPGGGGGIDLLQLFDGKWRRVLSGEIRAKIGQRGVLFPDALDDQAHLEAPVPEMHVADDMVSHIPLDAFDGLADDGGANVAHMQGFCHVGPAVVDDHGFRGCFRLEAELLSPGHLVYII